MECLPFVYLDLERVLEVSPYRGKTSLYAAINAGHFPAAIKSGGRSLWRSDQVAEANAQYSARHSDELAQKARNNALRLVKAKREKAEREKAQIVPAALAA